MSRSDIELRPGMPAPDFVALTSEGMKVRFSEFLGEPIWLIFYRYAGCPLCNLHIMSLTLRREIVEDKGLKVVAVFESEPEDFTRVTRIPPKQTFHLLADPKKKVYELYGTESRLSGLASPKAGLSLLKAFGAGFKQGKISGDIGQIPASFLINPEGIIETIHYGRHVDDHIPWQTVSDFAASLMSRPKTDTR